WIRPEDWTYFWEANVPDGSATFTHGAPGGRALPILLAAICFFNVACRQDMYNQPKAKAESESTFFKDGTNARPIPPHTIARGETQANEGFFTGLTSGMLVTQLPVSLTPQLLARGRERYDIYCSMCHGRTGNGNGMIAQ